MESTFPTRFEELRGRLEDVRENLDSVRENLDSEWSAVSNAIADPRGKSLRRYFGWALYRVATRLNPEIDA